MRQRLDDGVERLRQDGHLRKRIRTWKVLVSWEVK
jgi:hypothetical protein